MGEMVSTVASPSPAELLRQGAKSGKSAAATRADDLLARLSPTQSLEEGRAFVQRRIALFSSMMLASFALLLAFTNGMYAVYPQTEPEYAWAINIIAGCGLVTLCAGWSYVRGPKLRSASALLALDATEIVVICFVFGVIGFLSSDRPPNTYSAFIWMSFAVFARVLVIPSSGERTALLTGLGMAPTIPIASMVGFEDIPGPALVTADTIFVIVATTLASVGSNVIYGLRSQVRKAMQLGQYTLHEKIGEGGMGAVYRASHALLRRPTAIKLLRPQRTGLLSQRRFEREVQLTSQLTHPNTVAIYDYGRSPEGMAYYVMEYLDGIDLETLVRRCGPQPAERIVQILQQVCGSLQEAHDSGLVHRDIKPSNIIMISRGSMPDLAKVVDFGLAREIEKHDRLTHTDAVTGTPAYLAPEAVTDPGSVGPKSDLYSLGAVGYFLATGTTPFTGQTAIDVCMKHVTEQPVPPSTRTGNPLPAALDTLILRCLAKDPAVRPESAQQLRRTLASIDTSAWSEERAAQWWRDIGDALASDTHLRAASSLASITIDLESRSAIPIGDWTVADDTLLD